MSRLRRVLRVLFGDNPRALLVLCAPTAFAVALDVVVRGRLLLGYALQGKAIYLSSLLIGAAIWFPPLYLATRLHAIARAGGRHANAARAGLVALFALIFFPLATFCFPGQVLYRDVNAVYMGRNTLRLGIAFRTTVRDWFTAWAGPGTVLLIVGAGLLVTFGLGLAVRRAAAKPASLPYLSLATFVIALTVVWFDQVDSRFLQAATPDVCFIHGLVHTVRVAVEGKWNVRQGVSLRTPAALPSVTPVVREGARKPNVVVILTESVRADTLCSAPSLGCSSQELDAVAPDRIALGKLTTPTPNTFSACVMLWTGLEANADLATAHSAPVLWELARAAGYRTAYVTSQNPNYEDFGVYVRRAGIDVLQMATDLGGMEQEQIGAPDELATAAALRFAASASASSGSSDAAPYFAVVQLANTHMPYRVDPALQPNAPHSDTPVGDIALFRNHYRNSVLFQERILGAFLKGLRALPTWDDTVVVFLSDHGEQFREHHGLYHNHSLFEEELRIPGFIVAGAHVLDADRRAALATFANRRTYTQDVNATIVDLLGLHDARPNLPFGDVVVGRSLLRPRTNEPKMLLATSTAVWEPTDARFGVLDDNRMLVGSPTATWACFNIAKDPGEKTSLPGEKCPDLVEIARRAFASTDVAK